MRSSFLSLLLVLLTTVACQGLLPTPAPPTPTPLLLARATATENTVAPPTTASPTARPAISSPASPTQQPAAEATPAVIPPASAARLMAVGRRASIVLRAGPTANAAVLAQPAGSTVLWVEGRTADGRWLWVSYGDAGARAWAAAGDVQVFGELATVAVTDATGIAPPAQSTAAPTQVAVARPSPAAPRPTAVQPALTGKIAFQTAPGGDIYVLDATGTNLRRVTYGLDPALSPDGTQLAFARWDAPHGVFVIDLATGAERRVASADRPRSPTWQANGATLVFAQVSRDVACRQTPFGCLTDDALRRQFGGQDCVRTPLGQYCIGDFPVTQVSETGLVQVGTQGENRLDLPALNDAQSPAWHPQRTEVLYRGGGGLQVTAPNGTTRLLVSDASLNSPAWSPDGSRIAVQVRLHDNTDIFLLDAAGNRLARLTTGAGVDNVAPAWSPDGRYLVFLSSRDGAWRLYRMNADGSNQVPLAPAALSSIALRYDFAAERVLSWSR